MSLFTSLIVFLMIWWTAIFVVLPFGLKRDEDGTPKDPRLKHKLIMTTGLSVLLWIIVYVLIEADIISFREMAKIMAKQEE